MMRHVLMISFLFGLSIVTFSQTRKGTMCATDGNFPDVLKSTNLRTIDYMHYNPVKAGLCEKPEDYWYSSARYYELNEDDWGFLTQYEEHL